MDDLKKAIGELHESLAKTDNVDPELKNMLQNLDQDIRLTLMREELPAESEPSLQDRARMLAARFAAEHPVLEPTLREIADMLGKMGI